MNPSQTGVYYRGTWLNRTEFREAVTRDIGRVITFAVGLAAGFFAAVIWVIWSHV
jgi:hypothetical protein